MLLIVDPEDGHAHDKTLKIRSQQERQTRTMQLSREGNALSHNMFMFYDYIDF